jgi:exodeoxyribonuclease VII small subunit
MPKKKQSELPLPPQPSEAAEPLSSNGAAPARKTEVHFEQAVDRLNEIVDRLEAEEVALEDSLKLFEEGVRLARHAQNALDKAEKRVEELLAFDEAGNPVVQEIDSE